MGIPDSCDVALAANGSPDCQLFDFTSKSGAVVPFKMLGPEAGAATGDAGADSTSCHAVHLVGDALLAPFWPQGTGANRAILSALDTAHFISRLWGEGDLGQAAADRVRAAELMSRAEPKDLKRDGFGLQPGSRYTRF